MKIVIVGGGKVAAHLVSLLTAEFEHKITIIEMRRETSMYLADSLDIRVINGDGSDLEGAGGHELVDRLCAEGASDDLHQLFSGCSCYVVSCFHGMYLLYGLVSSRNAMRYCF